MLTVVFSENESRMFEMRYEGFHKTDFYQIKIHGVHLQV